MDSDSLHGRDEIEAALRSIVEVRLPALRLWAEHLGWHVVSLRLGGQRDGHVLNQRDPRLCGNLDHYDDYEWAITLSVASRPGERVTSSLGGRYVLCEDDSVEPILHIVGRGALTAGDVNGEGLVSRSGLTNSVWAALASMMDIALFEHQLWQTRRTDIVALESDHG